MKLSLVAILVLVTLSLVYASSIGSGGTAISRGVYASAPACTSQLIYNATDAALQGFCNGSVLDWKYKGVTVTPTVVADLPNWYAQGAAATATLPGSWILTGTTGAPHSLHGRTKAIPATPFSVVACMDGMASGVAFSGYGMIWTDGTKAVATEISSAVAGTGPVVSMEWFANSTTFSGTYLSALSNSLAPTGVFCLAMIDDGTNRKSKISFDGVNWTLLHSVVRTDFLTATQVGVYIDQGGTTLPPQVQVVSVVTLASAL